MSGPGATTGRDVHPSVLGPGGVARAAPAVERQAARLAARLAAGGVRHAQVAAAVLACRGRRVLDQADFAELVGVPVDHVRTLESGRRPPQHLPRRLAALDPAIDWHAAGVADPGDPDDPAARHPAAHQPAQPPPHRHEPTAGREHGP